MPAYNLFRSGFLPCAGGMNDQHCLFPDLMLILQSAFDKCDEYSKEIKDRTPNDGKVSLLGGG